MLLVINKKGEKMNNTQSIPTEEVVDLAPFKRLVMTIGTLPTAFTESMTYYEALAYFVKYLEEITKVVNENAEATRELQTLYTELKNYVDTYFENLDVQEEINNKLDDMAESGQLEEIIALYLNSNCVIGFDTVADMKTATNLVDGSFAKTYGFYNINDKGDAFYKIREITNDDVVDEMTIIELADDSLVAELIINDTLNLKTLGAKGDDNQDTSPYLEKAVSIADKYGTLYIPKGKYRLYTPVVIDKSINIRGDYSGITPTTALDSHYGTCLIDYTSNDETYMIDIYNSTKRLNATTIENLQLYGNEKQHVGLILHNVNCYRLNNLYINKFNHTGLKLDGCFDCVYTNINVMDCGKLIDSTPYYAVYITGTTENADSHFYAMHIEGGHYLLYCNVIYRADFEGCHFETWGDYTDYTNPSVKLGGYARSLAFVACEFILEGLDGYLSLTSASNVRYNIEIENATNYNNRIRFDDCYIGSGADGGKIIKSAGSTTTLVISNSNFYNCTVHDYAVQLRKTKFVNNHILYFAPSAVSEIYGLKFQDSEVINCELTFSVSFNSGATKKLFHLNNTKLENVIFNNSYSGKIYDLEATPYNKPITRFLDPVYINQSDYATKTGNVYDAANLSIPLNLVDTNHETLWLGFNEDVTLKSILGGYNSESIFIYNNSTNSITLSKTTANTEGTFDKDTTIPAGSGVMITKRIFKWHVV